MRDAQHVSPSIHQMTRDDAPPDGTAPREWRVGNAREALFADDLRMRLRHVCCDWDEEEFEALVQRIARIKLRWSDPGRGD